MRLACFLSRIRNKVWIFLVLEEPIGKILCAHGFPLVVSQHVHGYPAWPTAHAEVFKPLAASFYESRIARCGLGVGGVEVKVRYEGGWVDHSYPTDRRIIFVLMLKPYDLRLIINYNTSKCTEVQTHFFYSYTRKGICAEYLQSKRLHFTPDLLY